MRFWLLAVLIPLLAIASFVWMGPLRPEVKVLGVQRGRAVDAVSGTVSVLAARDLVIRSEVPGRVSQVCLDAGSIAKEVELGECIAVLDSKEVDAQIQLLMAQAQAAREREKAGSSYELELEQLNREIADAKRMPLADPSSQKRLEKWQIEAQRLQLLAEQEAINRREEVAAFAARLALLQQDKERMVFKSPMKGLLVESFVTPGDFVNVGAPILRILSNEKLIQGMLDEADACGVEPGQSALIHLNGRPGEVLRGRVQALSPMANPQTRQRSLYIALNTDHDPNLIPGMTGQLSITRAERPESLLVPRRALMGDKVLTVQDGKVKIQPVELGFRGLHYAEIISGLKEGEWIIVDDLHLYRDEQRVNAHLGG